MAIVEARMTSTRLPGKVLLRAAGKPLLEHLIERLRRVSELDDIAVATTTNSADDAVAGLAARCGTGSFRGSETDVLSRVVGAAEAYRADVLVEITADCPLIDPLIVSRCIKKYFSSGADYVSNVLRPTYPNGMDTQVFARSVLEETAGLTQEPADREHVSLYIYSHPEKYRLVNISAPRKHARPDLRLCVDTLEDYRVVSAIFDGLYSFKKDFGLDDILAFLDEHRDIAAINAAVQQKQVRR